MPRSLPQLFLLTFALTLSPFTVSGQMTLNQVQRQHVEAMGGYQRLQAIKSLTMRATVIRPDTTRIDLHLWKARPDRSRTLYIFSDGMRIIQGYDGSTAWEQIIKGNSEVVRPMEDDAAKRYIQHAFIGSPLTQPPTTGVKLTYEGLTPIEDRGLAHCVVVSYSHNARTTYFLDPEDFRELKIISTDISDGKTITRTSYPSDFRMVEGVLFAFQVVEVDEEGQRHEVRLESVTLNPGILDALFRKPRSER